MLPLTCCVVVGVRSLMLPAGIRAELAALQQIRSQSGEFGALLGRGPSAIQDLQQQVKDAGAAMMLLKHTILKHLIREVADLNDCHIVVVSARTGRPSQLALPGRGSISDGAGMWAVRNTPGAIRPRQLLEHCTTSPTHLA
jgi:hypothetical protein